MFKADAVFWNPLVKAFVYMQANVVHFIWFMNSDYLECAINYCNS